MLLACAAAAVGGCAGTARGRVEVARAEHGIASAEEAGARKDVLAASHLAIARRQLARARMLAEAGDAQGAEVWAKRALADAELARMLAIEAATRAAAERAEEEANDLSRRLSEPVRRTP